MVSLNFVQIKKLGNMGWVAVFGVHQREDKDSAHQREDKDSAHQREDKDSAHQREDKDSAPISSDVLQDNKN